MKPTLQYSSRPRRYAQGLSLIELMIALLLGLLVVGGALGIFLSNRRTYTATESVGRIQENARVAFEMMARDLREAGGNPCARGVPIANVLISTAGNQWWTTWGNGVQGYENGALGGASAGTDAIEIKSGRSSGATVITQSPYVADSITLNTTAHGMRNNDIAMLCDFRQAAIFQITTASDASATITHVTGAGTVGNCSEGLGFKSPMDCSTAGTKYEFGDNATLVKLQAARWYIAANGRGGTSLYRAGIQAGAVNAEEIVEGVSNLQLEYLVDTDASPNVVVPAADYVTADLVTQWPSVVAVRIDMALQGQENIGTDNAALRRNLSHVVTLRNRNP